MFKKLNSKFTKTLFCTVFILSVISCLTIGLYTSYIAVEDFKEKTAHVCKFYAHRFSDKLNGVVGTITLASTQGLFEMVESGQEASEIAEVLRYMTLGNNNITGATVVTKNTVHNARAAKVLLTENFGNDYRKTLEKYKSSTWVMGTSDKSMALNSLIYIYPRGNGTYMLISALVDSMFWDFEHTDNLFLKKADIYISDKNNRGIFVYKGYGKKNILADMYENLKTNKEYVNGKSHIYYFGKVPGSEIVLCMYIPEIYSAAQLKFIIALFVLVFAAVMVICSEVIKTFVFNITHPLELVCSEMKNHQKNYKRMIKEELESDNNGRIN